VRSQKKERATLARLIKEARALPAPELDWEKLEARLGALPQPLAAPAPRLSWTRAAGPIGGALALAAAVFLFVHRHPHAPGPSTSVQVPAARIASVDGDALALGQPVTAEARSVLVEHRARASWMLGPQSSAALTESGAVLTVRLERGAVTVKVVPNPRPETFAVEVAGARIAAHGTAYRVERKGDRVEVEVSEGTVIVEPASVRSDPAFVLHAGSRGSFALDGYTGSVQGDAQTIARPAVAATQHGKSSSSHAAKSLASSQEAARERADASRAALTAQPSIDNIESGVSSALDSMNRCFRRGQESNLRVSVQTAMTLTVQPSGKVQSVSFAPPLAPDVESCGAAALKRLHFARSTEGATFTRVLELKR
jgi:ferric-dicitrate binding protein FerR (iron transport regulator)